MGIRFLAVALMAPLILGGVSIGANVIPLLGHHPALEDEDSSYDDGLAG